jgi:hypothetical protein
MYLAKELVVYARTILHFVVVNGLLEARPLLELLAPELLVFFDQNWVDIGTKYSLQDVVSSVTGIGDLVYCQSTCMAQKMWWASRREATRVKDRAYSLMGLFGVNMPPLYGEGEKAFHRLQLEILKISDDESISLLFAGYILALDC